MPVPASRRVTGQAAKRHPSGVPRAYRLGVALSDAERLYVAIGRAVRSGADVEYALQTLVEKLLGHYGPLIARGQRFDLLYALALRIARAEVGYGGVLLGPLEAAHADIALRNKLVQDVWWESQGTFERVLFRPGRHEPQGPTALRVEELEDLDARLRAHYIELMRCAAWFTDRASGSQAP